MELLFVGGDFSQDVGAVDVGINLLPDLDDLAGGRDEEGVAGGELHVPVGHERDTVGVDDFVVGVGEELEAEGGRCSSSLCYVCRGRCMGLEAEAARCCYGDDYCNPNCFAHGVSPLLE